MKLFSKLSVIALCSLAMASCGGEKQEEATVKEAPKPQVKIAKVSSQMVSQTDTYTATVESDLKNNISPNNPLRIEKIYCEEGDVVKKGQVLVQLDASNLEQLKLQIDNSRVEFSRTEKLFKVGGASKAEYDNAKVQLNVMESQYAQLERNTQLRAPISGVVTARNYDNGDMYNGTPILTIEQINPVKLLINVSENHYKDVKKGQKVAVSLDAYDGEEFTGTITIVYPSVDATTHTFPVEITINNPAQRVRPGMFARATLNYGEMNHVVIPDVALVKQIGAGDRYVYVYDEKTGTVSYNRVELGKHMGDKYEIFSGVEDGQNVVIAGQARLANGIAVEVVK